MLQIVNNPPVKKTATLKQDINQKWADAKAQWPLFSKKLKMKPLLQVSIKYLTDKKSKNNNKLPIYEQYVLERLENRYNQIAFCASFGDNIDPFSNFYSSATLLVTNVKQNIQVLEQYKKFPMQLSKWMGAADSYLSDITSFLASTVTVLMQWMSTNAKIYSKYIDALILIVSSIKTWQILIDFSVNWSQKCGKCSRDSYGSYSCGLSFLLDKIKLPILPIPPFKIPNIYVDLSHIDL